LTNPKNSSIIAAMRQVSIVFIKTGDQNSDIRRLKLILAQSKKGQGADGLSIDFRESFNDTSGVVVDFENVSIGVDTIDVWRKRGYSVSEDQVQEIQPEILTDAKPETRIDYNDF